MPKNASNLSTSKSKCIETFSKSNELKIQGGILKVIFWENRFIFVEKNSINVYLIEIADKEIANQVSIIKTFNLKEPIIDIFYHQNKFFTLTKNSIQIYDEEFTLGEQMKSNEEEFFFFINSYKEKYILIVTKGNSIAKYDLKSNEIKKKYIHGTRKYEIVSFTTSNPYEFITSSTDSKIKHWNMKENHFYYSLEKGIYAAALQTINNYLLALTSNYNIIYIFDIKNRKRLKTVLTTNACPSFGYINSDKNYVICPCENGKLLIWDETVEQINNESKEPSTNPLRHLINRGKSVIYYDEKESKIIEISIN